VTPAGVNFSVFSKRATQVELLLFDGPDAAAPSDVVHLEAAANRTYHYWHVLVSGMKAGQIYGYRVHGPHAPAAGHRFDADKLLLDPYGRVVAVPAKYDRASARRPGDTAATAMKSVVVDPTTYDWAGDRPLHRPASQTIVYEMHVRGFTAHPTSRLADGVRGTYAGVIEKIPYLQDLGITAVELLPVFQFDPYDAPPGLVNYWGYAPVSFFAPHTDYSSRRDPLGAVDEFRDMVKALHRAGIEVILDVVFNHTAEGDHTGPTLCFRGFENVAYYMLEEDRSAYRNYTGCGNTLNANHPIVRRLILDSLRYWVAEMHVDGFRFDLASVLSRDPAGRPIQHPPILWDIESDPVLAGTKLIAEAWDAAGLYQVGHFAGDAWKEWNGVFRDDLRDFLRGVDGTAGRLADRLLGSHAVFGRGQREPEQSVNFATCHDGFTLNDLVSYDGKHNDPNGEQNRDGANDNRSWNCGVEGPTDDETIERLRNRQVKNFLTLTLLPVGMPMILMGDEVRRSQRGNNNAYCQDNEISWLDWTLVDRHADVHRFTRLLTARRVLRDLSAGNLSADSREFTLTDLLKQATIEWHGVTLHQPDWSPQSHTLAFSAHLRRAGLRVHLILNAFWQPLDFALPDAGAGRTWHRWIDTALESPHDIVAWEEAPPVEGASYHAWPRSVIVLWTQV
jgi:glycogen operon protein